MVEKLDYIRDAGFNAIELLPIHEFNELEYYQVSMLLVLAVLSGSEAYKLDVHCIDCSRLVPALIGYLYALLSTSLNQL